MLINQTMAALIGTGAAGPQLTGLAGIRRSVAAPELMQRSDQPLTAIGVVEVRPDSPWPLPAWDCLD